MESMLSPVQRLRKALGALDIIVIPMGIGRYGLLIHSPSHRSLVPEMVEHYRPPGTVCAGYMIAL